VFGCVLLSPLPPLSAQLLLSPSIAMPRMMSNRTSGERARKHPCGGRGAPSSSPSSRDISPCCSLDHNGNVVTAKERKKGKKGRDDLELAG
jgi:hypothetical protein